MEVVQEISPLPLLVGYVQEEGRDAAQLFRRSRENGKIMVQA